MTAERSNVLAFEPLPVGWLPLPLTQERAAAIVQFQARTGIDLIPHLLDALDDIVFDIAHGRPGTLRGAPHPDRLPRANEFALSRGETCVQVTRSESESISKSPAGLCGAPQEIAGHQNSALSGKPYSHPLLAQQQNLHPVSDAACAPPNMNSPASTIHPRNRSAPCSMKSFHLGSEGDA